MEETLGMVYRQQTGLLWRGQCLKCCEMSNKVFIANAWSFLSTPCIYIYIYTHIHVCFYHLFQGMAHYIFNITYICLFYNLFPGMAHYIFNITCFVLSSTLFKFLWVQSFGLILHILLFLFVYWFLVKFCSSFVTFCAFISPQSKLSLWTFEIDLCTCLLAHC